METCRDHESLDVIGKKIKAIAKVNQEILDLIEASKSKLVICRYYYSLKCEVGPEVDGRLKTPRNNNNDKPWSFETEKQMERVQQRIDNWCYNGEPLQEADDVFNDGIKYNLRKYNDVVYLNKKLLQVGMKHCDLLADRPKPRSNALIILKNLEKVQVALGELNGLLMDDATDESSELESSIEEEMKQILLCFEKVNKKMGVASLKIDTDFIKIHFCMPKLGNTPLDIWGNIPTQLGVKPHHKVIDIRKMINEKYLDKFRLSFGGELLKDKRTLQSYGIHSGSTIFILWKNEPFAGLEPQLIAGIFF